MPDSQIAPSLILGSVFLFRNFAKLTLIVYNPLVMAPYIKEILIVLGIVVAFLVIIAIHLEIRLRKLLRGNKAETIEDSIALIEKDIKNLNSFKKEMTEYLVGVEKRVGRSIQGVGAVRFNPFRGSGDGGNQSFALSLIDEKGNGVIISSLAARERLIVFAKSLENFKSEYEITEEEKNSLRKSKEKLEL